MSWTRPEANCTVTLECEDCGEWWHPEIFFEYRGVAPHGGMVAEYTADAFQCKECLGCGQEIRPDPASAGEAHLSETGTLQLDAARGVQSRIPIQKSNQGGLTGPNRSGAKSKLSKP